MSNITYNARKYLHRSSWIVLVFVLACSPLVTSKSSKDVYFRVGNPINEQPDPIVEENRPSGVWEFVTLSSAVWLVVDSDNILWKTGDKGNNWQKVLRAKSLLGKPSFIDAERGYVLCDHHLFASHDGGDSWNQISEVNDDMQGIYVLNEKLIWGFGTSFSNDSGAFGRIWKSEDAGLNWNEHEVAQRQEIAEDSRKRWNIKDLTFLDVLNGWAVGDAVVIYTNDGGEQWKIKRNLSGSFKNVEFGDREFGLIVEKELGASIFTKDTGRSWQTKTMPPIQNNSKLYTTDRFTILADSMGYVYTSARNSARWSNVETKNKLWNSFTEQDSQGSIFIGNGFDAKVVIAWFVSNKTLSLESCDSGRSWQ